MPTLKVKNNGIWETVSGIGGSGGSGGSGVAVQSDYAQNDSSAMDYIKNRPFYEIKETIFDQDVTTETDTDIEGFSGYFHPTCIVDYNALTDGDVFDVNMDGVTYLCEWTDGAIGNLYIFMEYLAAAQGMTVDEILANHPEAEKIQDTGEPFFIMFNYTENSDGTITEDSSFLFKETAATTHHFIIDGLVIHKLDSRFLNTDDLLPSVSTNNNGQILGVVNGAWAVTSAPSGLPTITTADNDKVLMVVNGAWVAGSIANGDEVYY